MKKIISFSFLCFVFVSCFSQAKISEMPIYAGNLNGAYVPIVVGGVNRKVDAGLLGFNKIDSIAIINGNLISYKGGEIVKSQALPAGGQVTLGFTPENIANRNAANGYAGLDNAGKVPVTLLPTGSLVYKGVWNASTNTPNLSNGVGTAGWQYNVGTAGTQNLGSGSVSFLVGDQIVYNGTEWERNPAGNNVQLVNGLQGTVVLKTGNVDTSGGRQYLSAAERAAWNAKVDINSPTFTGVPKVPTATLGTRSTQAASTDFVGKEVSNLPALNLISPRTGGYRLASTFNDSMLKIKAIGLGYGIKADSSRNDSILYLSVDTALIKGGGTTTTSTVTASDTLLLTGTQFLSPISAGGTYFMGSIPLSSVTSTGGVLRIYVPRAGHIKAANLFYTLLTGTLGSATELTKFSVIVNNVYSASGDIANVNWGSTREGRIFNESLNLTVNKGDYVEIRALLPSTYATLPTQARFSFWIMLTR